MGGRQGAHRRRAQPARALRIGARVEAGDTGIEAIRKKGRKNTLLDADGAAANTLETELERQLAGADRAFFTRMFSLNHEGLRAGGETLAAADANADTALLSAGSGLADVLAEREASRGDWQLTVRERRFNGNLQRLAGDSVALTLDGHRRRLLARRDNDSHGETLVLADAHGEKRLAWRRLAASQPRPYIGAG